VRQFHLVRWIVELPKNYADPSYCIVVGDLGKQNPDQGVPIQGDHCLLQLWRQIPEIWQGRDGSELPPLDQLRLLLVRLAQNWAHYPVFDWQPDVP
jgi:hypothetical protein